MLWDTVVEGIKSYLIETIVIQAVIRIATMFNPAGALVQALLTVWNVYQWLRENAARIWGIVEAVVNMMASLAAGNIQPAAAAIEQALAGLIPIAISLLANLLGLGGITDKVREVLEGLRETVRNAIRSLIQRVKALFTGGDPEAEEEEEEEEEEEGVIVEPVDMDGASHTLRIDPESDDVTLASTGGSLADQLATAWSRLREYEGSPQAAEARANIQQMQSLLQQIMSSLHAGDQVDRAQLRTFSRQTAAVLQAYGSEFHVREIIDGLPEFGPVVAGPHPIGNVSQPDGSTRESHHVPPKEVAQALGREMTDTATELRSEGTDAATAAAAELTSRAGPIAANPSGNRLAAISLHRVTHQNSGGVAVHAAAMREEIAAAIAAIDASTETETIRIMNTANLGDLAVNPSGQTIDSWIRMVHAALDREDADAAERAQAETALRQAQQQVDTVERAAVTRAEDTVQGRLGRIVETAFASSLTQGTAAVTTALSHSILDGPDADSSPAVGQLPSLARETWTAARILP